MAKWDLKATVRPCKSFDFAVNWKWFRRNRSKWQRRTQSHNISYTINDISYTHTRQMIGVYLCVSVSNLFIKTFFRQWRKLCFDQSFESLISCGISSYERDRWDNVEWRVIVWKIGLLQLSRARLQGRKEPSTVHRKKCAYGFVGYAQVIYSTGKIYDRPTVNGVTL